ncbi:MAG: ABC transporter substrate-binding protein [Armatimonadota bacterium]|nr:ABC transporter substrate-binding protein [Armatimonadota bacterium]MDR7475980.1 ABC transporter substrate-binding protein [Armatimonadota bacterium]MDR7537919.1 ABC transporter substrate-binding protein [Armatimonadota bacterium]
MRSQLARILLLSVLLVGLTGPVWGPAPEGAVPTESATCLPGVEVTGGIALPAALAAGAPPTVKVGYSAPFTGAAAEFGTNGWRGIQLALEEINAKGLRVAGKTYRVAVVRYDDRCEPTEGAANVRKLVLVDKVVAVLGSHCSSVCVAMADLLDEFKVPGLTIECAADKVTSPGHPFYFRARPSVGLMAPLATPKLVKIFKPKTAGFLAINDDYGRGFAQAFENELSKRGVKTTLKTFFERGTTDFSVHLTQAKTAAPDIVFYVGVTPEGALILKQAKEFGLTPRIKFVGSEEMSEMELLKLAGAAVLEGTYSIALWGSVPQQFADRVQKKFGAPMHYAIIYGYDAMWTVARAIEGAQALDPVKVRDAMKRVQFQGLQGFIKFEDFDTFKNQGRYSPWLIQWVKGQRKVVTE